MKKKASWGRLEYATGAFLVLLISATAASAKESCWREGPTQFADETRYCVSSVLPQQGKRAYGPKGLLDYYGVSDAWCEGVAGNGLGETIVIRIKRGPAFRRLLLKNGYSRSQKSFRNNGRLKRVRITSDTGIDMKVQLQDQPQEQVIRLPKVAPHKWIRVEILAVYSGARYRDTCVTALGPDFVYEEELLTRQQQMDPERPSEASRPKPPPVAKSGERERPLSTSDDLPDVAVAPQAESVSSGREQMSTEDFDIDAAIALSSKEAMQPEDPELVLWNRIKFSKKPADLQLYLSKYPAGAFAAVARRQLQKMRLQQKAAERK